MTLLYKNLLQLHCAQMFILKQSAPLLFKKGVKRRFSFEIFQKKTCSPRMSETFIYSRCDRESGMGHHLRAAHSSVVDTREFLDSRHTQSQNCLFLLSSSFTFSIMVSGFKLTQNWFAGLKKKKKIKRHI